MPTRNAIVVLLASLLVACTPRASSERATLTPSTTPTSAPTAIPDGLVEYSTDAFTMVLPEHWQPITLSGRDEKTIIAEIEKQFPQMAELTDLDTAFANMYMTAFNTKNKNPSMVDNLNIQLLPSEGMSDLALRLMVDDIAQAMEMPNITLLQTDSNIVIQELAAIYISFQLDFTNASQEALTSIGHQYYILNEDELWILTYTIDSSQEDVLTPIITQSAYSFRPK